MSRYDDVALVLKDARFSSDPRFARNPPLFGFGGRLAPKLIKLVGDAMICVDDPAHARLRKLVAQAFTPRSIDEMEGSIRYLVDEKTAELARRESVDLIADFALPLALTVISDMLGIPDGWRLSFHHQIARLIEVNDQPLRRAIRWAPAMPRLVRFFERLIDVRRQEPDDRLVARLIAAEDGGDRLSRDELAAMIFLLLFAGHETSVNLIGNGMLALLDHPAQLELLRQQPELMPNAVEELLRFTTPVEYGTARYAKEAVVVGDVTVAAGDLVIALQASANRDETAFARADQLDITRASTRHLAFGAGLHYCLGAGLGRLETRIALEALLQRFPRMCLAVPRDTLKWRQATGLRGLMVLPVEVDPA